MSHHFILLQLIPFDISVEKGFSGRDYLWSKDGVVWLWHLQVNFYIWLNILSCYCSIHLTLGLIGRDGGLRVLRHSRKFPCKQELLKAFPGLGCLCSEDWVVWLWQLHVTWYISVTISSCYGSFPLTLELIGRDGGLCTLCHCCGFACQQGLVKTFPCPGYQCSKDGVVWLWHLLVNLYISLTISTSYGSISLTLGLIRMDDGLSALWHSCGFACQQRMPITFSGPGYLCPEDGVVSLSQLLVNLYIWLTISSCCLSAREGMLVWALCVIVQGLILSRGC